MRVYLDNNATTPAAPEVIDRMVEVMRRGPLNPGSMHGSGRIARQSFEAAQQQILDLIGLPERRVVFCGSATEAVNLVLRGVAGTNSTTVVHTSVEHPAVVATAAAVGAPRIVAVDREGRLDLDAWKASLAGATIASCMYANNETGGVLPLADVAASCRAAAVPLLVDACQSPGKTDFFATIPGVDPDFLVFSGQKIHGPVGVAALVVRRGITLRQQTTGGGQQGGSRAGTEPVALATALAEALTLAKQRFDRAALRAATARLWTAITSAAPNARLTIPEAERRLDNTLHYRIPGLASQRQVVAFDMAGVECSSASACESGSAEPSKVMLGMGYTREEAMEGVRLSVSRYTTDAEIDFAANAIGTCIKRMLSQKPIGA